MGNYILNIPNLIKIDKEDVVDEFSLKLFLLQSSFNSRTLFHYTTYESLLKILCEKSFRLTRLDLLNDKAEVKLGNPKDAGYYYVMSFTRGTESPAMWKMYGKPSGIKIRLGFNTKNFLNGITGKYYYIQNNKKIYLPEAYTMTKPEDSFNDRIVFADVVYIDKRKGVLKQYDFQFKNLAENEMKYRNMKGFIKYSAWDYEKERRIRLNLSNISEDQIYSIPEYIFIEINESLIKDFQITYNPWMSPELKKEIKRSLDYYAKNKLDYSNSLLEGEVSEL